LVIGFYFLLLKIRIVWKEVVNEINECRGQSLEFSILLWTVQSGCSFPTICHTLLFPEFRHQDQFYKILLILHNCLSKCLESWMNAMVKVLNFQYYCKLYEVVRVFPWFSIHFFSQNLGTEINFTRCDSPQLSFQMHGVIFFFILFFFFPLVNVLFRVVLIWRPYSR